MKRQQNNRLGMESLENRQLLTSVTTYTYDALDRLAATTDNSDVAEIRDTDGDLDIYVTNGPGTSNTEGGGIANNTNQLWGDWF